MVSFPGMGIGTLSTASVFANEYLHSDHNFKISCTEQAQDDLDAAWCHAGEGWLPWGKLFTCADKENNYHTDLYIDCSMFSIKDSDGQIICNFTASIWCPHQHSAVPSLEVCLPTFLPWNYNQTKGMSYIWTMTSLTRANRDIAGFRALTSKADTVSVWAKG